MEKTQTKPKWGINPRLSIWVVVVVIFLGSMVSTVQMAGGRGGAIAAKGLHSFSAFTIEGYIYN